MKFRGKLVFSDGTEISGITGDYQVRANPRGTAGWSGTFAVPPGKFVGPDHYQLVLDETRSASIIVDNVSAGSRQTTIASFTGNGPPP